MDKTKTIPVIDHPGLLEELDKGIDDMENGRITAHEDTMKILMRRYNDHYHKILETEREIIDES